MHRHFTPDKYQTREKQYLNKQTPPAPRQEKYSLRILSNLARKKTDLFYLTFDKNPDEAMLVDALRKAFGDRFLRLTKPWAYEVQLSELVDWREVQRLVAVALEGLV